MNRIKIIIINWILKNLFNSITEKEVLKYINGKFIVEGTVLSKSESQKIVNGADKILSLDTWKYLNQDLKYGANKMIYDKQQTVDDALFGKAVLYVIDLQEKKLKHLTEIK